MEKHLDPKAIVDRIRSFLRPTVFIESECLNRSIGHGVRVVLVSETFQHTGSFKFRAGLSVALHSEGSELVTASSGNFGAALAAAAERLKKPCTVVMPAQSARVKIEAVRSYGAVVDLIETNRISRAGRLEELGRAKPSAQIVSPYDDPYVIAGNASLGWEIFASPGDLAVRDVIVPVGGGGLSSGIVVARNYLNASQRIWGAEPVLANDAARSFRSGRLETNAQPEPPTLCDGARTPSLGKRNFEILTAERGLEQVIEVDESNISEAVRILFTLANLKAEPTGALSLGAVLQCPERFAERRVACVVSGGNVDVELFARLVTAKTQS